MHAPLTPSTLAGLPPFSNVLQDIVLDSDDINAFLTGLAQEAARLFSVPGNEVLAAVTLLRPRTKATVGSSSDRARLMDEVQYRFDDGPCLRAARKNTVYVVTDFHAETRFGQYSAAVRDHGLRSAVARPIPLDGGAAAALDLYSTHVAAFDDEAVNAAGDMAREASKSLRMAVRIAHLSEANRHLHTAMESRTAIQVATGIIMAQNRCTHDTAMTILKAASSARNLKLRDVAEVVMLNIGQTEPDTHFDR